jgi:lysophospholipase L1-like esterase
MQPLIRALAVSWCAVLAAPALVRAAEPELPKVVLFGDSIRLGYAPLVAKRLEGKALIISPAPNGGDSANVLRHLQKEVISHQPAIVHFNCGIHDIKKSKTAGTHQQPPEQYEANLRQIVERLRKETKAQVFFATTTPVIDDRAAKSRMQADYELLDASTRQYNEIARRVMHELDVPIDDVRAALGDADSQARLLGGDGIHFTDEGKARLADAVAEFLLPRLPAVP